MYVVALKSALEDFEGTSLAAVPGLLGKLRYLAKLRDENGGYCHWGMGRVHGKEAAGRAIGAVHSQVLTKFLRTPLRVLLEDLKTSALNQEVSIAELLSSLEERPRDLLPQGALAATQKHAMAVLHALSALVEHQEAANRRDALQRRQPDQ